MWIHRCYKTSYRFTERIKDRIMYFKNVVEKALNNSNLYIYRDLLIESGANINRIIHHFDSSNLCFITAYRNTNSKNKNELENKKLAMEIPSLGYDYLRLNGKYKEDGNDEFTDENSFMIIDDDLNEINQDNFFLNMLKLCKQYNQDSVLISLPNNKKYPIAIYDNNGKILYGPFIITSVMESSFRRPSIGPSPSISSRRSLITLPRSPLGMAKGFSSSTFWT